MQKNNNRLKKLKVKNIEKKKKWKKNEKRKKETNKQKNKRKTPQNCKSPTQMQRFITTLKSLTEYTHIHISP